MRREQAARGSPVHNNIVIGIAAHPDDIEFYMAGTLLLLRQAGWEIHYFNLGSGNQGSKITNSTQTAAIRRREAQQAARRLQAVWHPPICHDLEIFYEDRLLRRVAAVVREVHPSIVLTHSPQDYMEDHTNTCRLAVSAAFVRGFPNYQTLPRRSALESPVTIYHAMPHMLRDPLGKRILPEAFVDISSVLEHKRRALAAHRSQKEWLDATQGMDSYLQSMEKLSREVGRMSNKFRLAEGWRKHLHAGFCGERDDPLRTALQDCWLRNRRYHP
jgi:LmbE family N-acetylglucosaminyl deacetylase